MRPIDIYNSPHIVELTGDDAVYEAEYFLEGVDTRNDGMVDQDLFVVRIHFDPYLDGTRTATLGSAWWKDALGDLNAAFIFKKGGRPDYEHYARYITDPDLFGRIISYLKSMEIYSPYSPNEEEVVTIKQDVPDLDLVYNFRITKNDLGKRQR